MTTNFKKDLEELNRIISDYMEKTDIEETMQLIEELEEEPQEETNYYYGVKTCRADNGYMMR